MRMNKGIVLLSGGLDSVVSLAEAKEKFNVSLAITFNYGQKSFEEEAAASKKIAEYYNITHKIINLDWLASITNTSLVSDEKIPSLDIGDLDNVSKAEETAKAVWVPNRNGLFVNIAGCFADAYGYNYIVIGANSEEAATFKDNSKEFIEAVNFSLGNSVNQEVNVIAPMIDCDKYEIVRRGIELEVPFHLIRSCYGREQKHCSGCESCNRLKRALLAHHRHDLIKILF